MACFGPVTEECYVLLDIGDDKEESSEQAQGKDLCSYIELTQWLNTHLLMKWFPFFIRPPLERSVSRPSPNWGV